MIPVLTKASGAPALSLPSFMADKKAKFQLKPTQFLE